MMEERPAVTDNVIQQNETVSDPTAVLHEMPPAEASHVPVNLMQGIAHDMQNLLEEMVNIRRDFETKVMYDESKERVIETLHRELQEHREGLHFRILKPIFIDLIAMYDDLDKQIEHMNHKDNPLAKDMQQKLKLFQEDIEEILRHNDVDTFCIEEDIFLPSKQKILKVIPTNNVTLDRHIARRVRKGFRCGDRLLRPEIVETYKYTPITQE
jgi:molecular chaperone GrpE